MKIYLNCILLFCTLSASAKNVANEMTIEAHLPAKSIFRLRYLDDYLVEQVLEFKNSSKNDSVLSKNIISDKIVQFTYSLKDLANNRSYFSMFCGLKGHILKIGYKNFELKNLGNDSGLFVSDFLQIDNSIFSAPVSGTVEQLWMHHKTTLNTNLNHIDSLAQAKKITPSTVSLWKELSHNFYIEELSKLNYQNNAAYLAQLTDTLQNYLLQKSTVNSPAVASALYSLVYYRGIKETNRSLYTNLQELTKINTEKKYSCGIAFKMLADFPEKNSALYLSSYNWFKEHLLDPDFQNQPYAKTIVPAQKAFDRSAIKMLNRNTIPATLAAIFEQNNGKVMVFDFWASWCIPCIEEIPKLETIKKRMSTKNIAFVSISLDKDLKNQAWKNLSEKLKITGAQYRVLEKSNKSMSTQYKITTIPRYLVFDQQGMLINDNFVKPSDPDFETKLLNYVH